MKNRFVWQSQRIVDAAAWIVLSVAAASAFWLYPHWSELFPASQSIPVPGAPISLEGASLKGNPKARVVLMEFSDYQCPFCKVAEGGLLQKLTKEYIDSGAVQLAFRHYPLERIHPDATRAAEAALCAGRQGQFWAMHAALFEDQKRMDPASLTDRARMLNLDQSAFAACVAGATRNQVHEDARQAEQLGLSGTPAFLIVTCPAFFGPAEA